MLSGGDYIYVIILLIFAILLSYSFLSYYEVSRKAKYIAGKNKPNLFTRSGDKFLLKVLKGYGQNLQKKLFDLGHPYGFTLKKYLIYKYVFSILVFFIIIFRQQNFVLALCLGISFFFLPDILVITFQKRENIQIINEISNVVQNIILSLSSNVSVFHALQNSKGCIRHKRFAQEFAAFVDRYQMYHYNMQKAVQEFEFKFHSYECNMFLSILVQGEKEGSMLNTLESFYESLQVMYFKYLKLQSSQRVFLVSIATLISLLNSFMIVLYPLGIQISENFTEILK